MSVLSYRDAFPSAVYHEFFIGHRKYGSGDCLLPAPFLAYFRFRGFLRELPLIDKVSYHSDRNQKEQRQYPDDSNPKGNRIADPISQISVFHDNLILYEGTTHYNAIKRATPETCIKDSCWATVLLFRLRLFERFKFIKVKRVVNADFFHKLRNMGNKHHRPFVLIQRFRDNGQVAEIYVVGGFVKY